jgi:hypothetical protein
VLPLLLLVVVVLLRLLLPFLLAPLRATEAGAIVNKKTRDRKK